MIALERRTHDRPHRSHGTARRCRRRAAAPAGARREHRGQRARPREGGGARRAGCAGAARRLRRGGDASSMPSTGPSASCSSRRPPPARPRCGSTAPAIDAARAAGVRRVVYTSHMGANPLSAFAPMPDHAATEAMLQESGLAFTALRNGFYASSGLMLLGHARETGEVVAPEDGPVSWTDHADLAEAAAIALTEDGVDGPTPPLTGSEAVDLAGLAGSPPRSPDGRSGGPWSPTRGTGSTSWATASRGPLRTCSWACSRRAAGVSSRRSTRPSSACSAGRRSPSATSSRPEHTSPDERPEVEQIGCPGAAVGSRPRRTRRRRGRCVRRPRRTRPRP